MLCRRLGRNTPGRKAGKRWISSGAAVLRTARLCEGDCGAALELPLPQWLKNGDFSSLSLFFGGMGFDKLVYGKALLAQGEYLKLEAPAGLFDDAFAAFQNRLGFLHGAILQAAAKAHLSGADAAVPELESALDRTQIHLHNQLELL